ncbi:MAG: amino acid permease [Armatimonadetes bacterium]|nr:amino acid permease [Armatimonadota bacterium]
MAEPKTTLSSPETTLSAPRPTLSLLDAVALVVGVVVGAGIFRTPSLVAANTGSMEMFLLAWLLGGAISLAGALCYAELATAYPDAGGDYHFLNRAYGGDIGFLFAWARMMVIQTGSIAMLGFIFGDYATEIMSLGGAYSPALYAALAIIVLTTLHLMHVHQGTGLQKLLVGVKLLGLLGVVGVGLTFAFPPAPATASAAPASEPAFGMAMIFVLLTFGGWNEAAYFSAELRDVRRNMARALLGGIGLITAIYLLINFAYYRGLGIEGMKGSEAVAADLMRAAMGPAGATFISVLVAIAALGSTNATIFTGARSAYALGRDFPAFGFLGRWHDRSQTPTHALMLQAVLALALVVFGSWTRNGFSTMVDYTAPVFWFFFLLAGLSVFVLRAKDPDKPRPFRIPLYPLTPLAFCASCIYMLNSSLSYTGIGAWVGVGVLIVGMLILAFVRPPQARLEEPRPEGLHPDGQTPNANL